MNIGILGGAEIAYRRFLPEVLGMDGVRVLAVAEEHDRTRLDRFCTEYGLEGTDSFEKLLARTDIDAVYIPLPPALHFKWAVRALECGRHVLVEKPAACSSKEAEELVRLAASGQLALHENYMFQYHSQIAAVLGLIQEGEIGDVRLMRADFGFPLRESSDFRYSKALGGGALLDAGGYVLRLAARLLGDTVHVDAAKLSGLPGYEVDMFGSVMLSNSGGTVLQAAFGMDNAYRCSLEVWGSRGTLRTGRIFTAPPNYNPTVTIETQSGIREVTLEADTHFRHSVEKFCTEIIDQESREQMYREIQLQARLVEQVRSRHTENELF